MEATHKISGRTVFITAVVSGTRRATWEYENDDAAPVQLAKCFVNGGEPTVFLLTDLEVHADASLLAWVQSPEWAYGISFERWTALERYAAQHGGRK